VAQQSQPQHPSPVAFCAGVWGAAALVAAVFAAAQHGPSGQQSAPEQHADGGLQQSRFKAQQSACALDLLA
jgi:hypothetical protein